MSDHEYDNLEQFFRKAAANTDVSFNEEDWKKLEKRLDATGGGTTIPPKSGTRFAVTVATGVLLVVSAGLWFVLPGEKVEGEHRQATMEVVDEQQPNYAAPQAGNGTKDESQRLPAAEGANNTHEAVRPADPQATNRRGTRQGITTASGDNKDAQTVDHRAVSRSPKDVELGDETAKAQDETYDAKDVAFNDLASPDQDDKIIRVTEDQRMTQREHGDVGLAAEHAERDKQKADVELPGAEEDDTREARAVVQEELASDREHAPAPRLSLLLSFAPDFSGTSIGMSSSPGKAYGVTVEYRPWSRWGISAGVIRNKKVYTGNGEDYHPPRNYWKYYTNGVIPETIDGSCAVLEFPVMIRYTVVERSRSRWNVSLGASSYLMQSESYRYRFSNPNPGAKEGWDSRASSRFLFNMVNLAVGYERQVMPGVMLGVEPYLKIPVEEIGWPKLRLFSSGLSVTLRYNFLHRPPRSPATQARGPD